MRKKDMARALDSYDLTTMAPIEYYFLVRSVGVLHRNGRVNIVNARMLHQELIRRIVPEDAWQGGPDTVEPLLKANTPETRLLRYVDELWRQSIEK